MLKIINLKEHRNCKRLMIDSKYHTVSLKNLFASLWIIEQLKCLHKNDLCLYNEILIKILNYHCDC